MELPKRHATSLLIRAAGSHPPGPCGIYFGEPRPWLGPERDSEHHDIWRLPAYCLKWVDKPAVKIMFQVTEIVRFMLERGLRFRNLGFCGHNLM